MTRTCRHCHNDYDDALTEADAWDSYCSVVCQANGWRALNFLEIVMEWLKGK